MAEVAAVWAWYSVVLFLFCGVLAGLELSPVVHPMMDYRRVPRWAFTCSLQLEIFPVGTGLSQAGDACTC